MHITDLTFPSFKSAFACCCYMHVPNTSPKLDSTQGCHTPSISVSLSLFALSLSVACCANLENLFHREVQSWCHYKSIVYTPHSHPLKHPQVKKHNGACTHRHVYRNNAPLWSVSADSADPGGKHSCVVWAFLSPRCPTPSNNNRKGELPGPHLHHQLNTAGITSKSFSL